MGEGLVELLVRGRAATPAACWPLVLTRALAAGGVSLLEGRVVQRGGWRADLVVEPGPGSAPDFGSLLRTAAPVEPTGAEPRLIDFQLDPPGSTRGADRARAHLEVHAWDALGLLAGVLSRVVGHGLSVEELLLETEGECAFHRLVLGAAPLPLTRIAGGPGQEDAPATLLGRVDRLERTLSKLCA